MSDKHAIGTLRAAVGRPRPLDGVTYYCKPQEWVELHSELAAVRTENERLKADAALGANLRTLVSATIHPSGWDSGGVVIQRVVRLEEGEDFFVVYEQCGLYGSKYPSLDTALAEAVAQEGGAAMLPGETLLTGAPPTCDVCGEQYGLNVMQSNAGWYIGSACCNGPNTRESRYWDTKEETEIALVAWTRGVCVGRRGA